MTYRCIFFRDATRLDPEMTARQFMVHNPIYVLHIPAGHLGYSKWRLEEVQGGVAIYRYAGMGSWTY